MSKISNIGTLNDGVDTSVPGIEMVDINDGDILARTRENVNPNGLFQFIFTPDDGTAPITSDWVDQEHKKKLTRVWVDGVKSAIVGRAQSKLQEAKDAAEEAKARKLRVEQFAEINDVDGRDVHTGPVVGGDDSAILQPVSPGRSLASQPQAPNQMAAPKVSATVANPADYIQDQLEVARERLRAAEAAQQDIIREVLTARRDYERWKALSSAIDGIDGTTGSSGGNAIPQAIGQATSSNTVQVAVGNSRR